MARGQTAQGTDRVRKGQWYRAARRPNALWHILDNIYVSKYDYGVLVARCDKTLNTNTAFEVVAEKPTEGRFCEKCIDGR